MIPFLGPLPGANFAPGREGRALAFAGENDPTFIVLHTMGGTVASTDASFKNPASKTSAHYGVELNGSVVQWVQEADTAYHTDSKPTNLRSIGIEHEDGGNKAATRSDALYGASAALVSDLCARYGIPVERKWIIKHSEAPGTKTSCPDGLDADRIVAMAAAITPTRAALPADTVPVATAAEAASNGGPDGGVATIAPPAGAQPSAPAPGGSVLKDIASTVYRDPERWVDVYKTIQGVVDEVPIVKLMEKMIAQQPPASQGGAGQAQKVRFGSQTAVFFIQVAYLILLAGLAGVYFKNRELISLPATLGPIPIAIPWFGALGAVLISVVGITQHRHDWDPAYRYWHWARPLLGASFGTISVLIFQAGILAVGTLPSTTATNAPKDLLYYLVAFVVGYREETFRELIKRLTDVVFSPGQDAGAITTTSMNPARGPAAGGTPVIILGGGFDGADSVRFGSKQAAFHVDGDGQMTVTSPQGPVGTTVNVVVSGKPGSAIAGGYTYE